MGQVMLQRAAKRWAGGWWAVRQVHMALFEARRTCSGGKGDEAVGRRRTMGTPDWRTRLNLVEWFKRET